MDGLACKKDGKPFTCLCGEGRFRLGELYDHMTHALPYDGSKQQQEEETT